MAKSGLNAVNFSAANVNQLKMTKKTSVLTTVLGVLLIVAVMYYFNVRLVKQPVDYTFGYLQNTLTYLVNLVRGKSDFKPANDITEPMEKEVKENMDLMTSLKDYANRAVNMVTESEKEEMTAEPAPVESGARVFQNNEQNVGANAGEVLSANELLPKDVNAAWADLNPEGQGSLKAKNFLEAGYHLGINTQGQSLRNANLQLRSEPPNPQVPVSPWLQSTIEPDLNRRPLDIGY